MQSTKVCLQQWCSHLRNTFTCRPAAASPQNDVYSADSQHAYDSRCRSEGVQRSVEHLLALLMPLGDLHEP